MPNQDGTGPIGLGYGRGMGPCGRGRGFCGAWRRPADCPFVQAAPQNDAERIRRLEEELQDVREHLQRSQRT